MARKAPRRTAERILEASLGLFNRFGEPNVSTTAIAAELGISPGNLYYHYPAKEGLVNALFARYQEELGALLPASGDVNNVEDAWFFMHTLLERIWDYRFLYRDVNHLVTHNRVLEAQFPAVLLAKTTAMRQLLLGLNRSGALHMGSEDDLQSTATSLVVVLTYWLSFEYVRDPRRALEAESGQAAMLQGARHALGLLMPYLEQAQQTHLAHLASAYKAGV